MPAVATATGTDVFAAFGPETADADKYAGALSLTDARILAFPVRSLCGVFAWVTCRAVLDRLNRDLNLTGIAPLAADFSLGAGRSRLCRQVSPAGRWRQTGA